MSYIIKSSFELRSLLSYYDLEGIRIRERIIRKKGDHIVMLWRVMTSHIKIMMNKSC